MSTYMPTTPEEMMYLYVDGELETSYEQALFAHLSSDGELRNEMRDLMTIRHGVQKDVLIPGKHVREAMLASAGFVAPAAPASMMEQGIAASGQNTIFQKFGIPFFSAVVGAVIAVGCMTWSGTGKLATPVVAQKTTLPTDIPSHAYDQQSTEAAPATHPSLGNYAVHNNQQTVHHDRYSSVRVEHDEVLQTPVADKVMESENIFPERTRIEAVLSYQPSHAMLSSPVSGKTTVPVLLAQQPLNIEGHDSPLHLSVRSILSRSFPASDLQPKSHSLLQNVAVGLTYDLSRAQTIGIELGQEPFVQVFEGKDNTTLLRYEQQSVLAWGGVTYTYAPVLFEEYDVVRPYVGGMLGMALPGFPLGRTTLGIQFTPESRATMMLGIEGTWMFYQYQNQWFTTRKAGLTYGISLHF